MATKQQWKYYTGAGKTGNEQHAVSCQETPLEADAILDLVMENLYYFGDHYYEPITTPVEMRVEEYIEYRDSKNV